MDFLIPQNVEIFRQLLLALLLGALIGTERHLAGKEAGMRTFALVSLGSAIFSIVSVHALDVINTGFHGPIDFNPTQIAGQIVTGVGFIGAGVIIFDHSHLKGITTAAGLWVSAAVGMAVGFGMYGMAVFASVLALLTFIFFWFLEGAAEKLSPYNHGHEDHHRNQE